MKYYFESEERQEQLKNELKTWVGTRFRHHASVKKMGCDCIGFVEGVFRHFNLLAKDFKMPEYDRDWHLHKISGLLVKSVKKTLNVDEIKLPDIKNGDLCFYRFGKDTAHVGIYCDGYLYHATCTGVLKLRWAKCLYIAQKRAPLTMILRLKEGNPCQQEQ